MKKTDPIVGTAQSFLNRFGLDCGSRLEQVLPEIGLVLHTRAAKSYEGALLRIKDVPRGYVVLSSRIILESRRRFTLAHEIGHYILPTQQNLLQPCAKGSVESWDRSLPRAEVEANVFAAEILMPRARLGALLRQSPTLAHVEDVAALCGASLTASAHRLASLTTFRMAVVWCEAGLARWYKASEEFGCRVRMGALSSETIANHVFRNEPISKSPQSVPASAWLFERGLRPDARILEQSLALPAYDAVLTILLIPDPIENRDESDPDEFAELDPIEFTLNRQRWPSMR